MESTERQRREFQERYSRLLEKSLERLQKANTERKFVAEIEKLDNMLDEINWPGTDEHTEGINAIVDAVLDRVDRIPPMADDLREAFRDNLIHHLERLVDAIGRAPKLPAENIASIRATEKDFLSKKVPKEVAENIASYLSGEKGAIGAQMSKLRVKEGGPGVPSRGGRKTKKNKSSKKKTHGRRV